MTGAVVMFPALVLADALPLFGLVAETGRWLARNLIPASRKEF